MALADLDLDAGVVFSPPPDEMFYFSKSLVVFVVVSVLADLESAVGVDQHCRQIREAIKKETVGDQHEVAIGPVLSCEPSRRRERKSFKELQRRKKR